MEQRQTSSVALQNCTGEDSLNSELNWQTGGQELTDTKAALGASFTRRPLLSVQKSD